jgi:L-fuconolactonase
LITDAQIHVWSSQDDLGYPWGPNPLKFFSDTPVQPFEKVIADMDEARVDAALVVQPNLYEADNSYALAAARAYPDRLRVVARIEPTAPEHRRRLEELMADPLIVGIRMSKFDDAGAWGPDGLFGPMLAAAEELRVSVAGITGTRTLHAWADVAKRHPALCLIVDHLGMEPVPASVPEPGPEPFRLLPNLLELAQYPNVCVKMTGSPALSNEDFPYRDIWPALARIVSAFGADRVMWGSDFNRVLPLLTYREGVDYFAEIDLFDEDTKDKLYNRTLRAIYDWPE